MGAYEKITPEEFYSGRDSTRKPYTDRAKKFAKLTLPYVFTDDSNKDGSDMADTIHQSYGGRLVNSLKSKMGMALLPAVMSSFRFILPPDLEDEAKQTDSLIEATTQLANITISINKEIERQAIRESLFTAILHMMIVGSIIIEKKPDDGVILHPLDTFVADLDSQGNARAFCFIEKIYEVPEGFATKDLEESKDGYNLYTYCYKEEDSDKYKVVQQIEGGDTIVEVGTYDKKKLPYQYLGWTWIPGSKYHRPYVEDYYRDLQQLNNTALMLNDGSLVASKVLILVDERGGRTRKRDVAESNNGDVIDGNADDITSFQLNKNFDFNVVKERETELKKELAAAFLMNESVTRQAERVTAQEIRFLAQELEESSLSGIYSMMAQKWSKWIVNMIMEELSISFESIEPKIITGIDALGRTQEAQKLDNFVSRATNLGYAPYIKPRELLDKYAALEGIDVTGFLKTDEEVKQEMAAQQQQAQEQEAMSEFGRAGAGAVVEQMKEQGGQ